MQNSSQKIRIVIPTTGTPERTVLLADRALKSLMAQNRKPDSVTVVCDNRNDNEVLRLVKKTVERIHGSELTVVPNHRTPGIAGALNTGIMNILKQETAGEDTWIAFLDDDDEWMPEYLESVAGMLAGKPADVVASDFIRIDETGRRNMTAPPELNIHNFFRGNPGIQGSNMVVRLKTLLRAGMFDEALVSTTDRDMMIRIAQLPGVKYTRNAKAIMVHHAEPGRTRISSSGSQVKCNGLMTFYRKYAVQMTSDDKQAFLKRALEIFHCDPSTAQESTIIEPKPVSRNKNLSPLPEISPVFAIILDPARLDALDLTIDQVNQLFYGITGYGIKSVTFIILKNGPFSSREHASLSRMADKVRANGGLWIEHQSRQYLPISLARTMVQHMAYQAARRMKNPVVWVKDDELLLKNLHSTGRSLERRLDPKLPQLLRRLYRAYKDGRLDVGIGGISGAPPIPAAATLRTQLLDLYANLARLLNPDAGNGLFEIDEMKDRLPDYYYDLSHAYTNHLELPFKWIPRAGHGNREIDQILRHLDCIPKGCVPFRPLLQEDEPDIENLISDVHRGGNTLVFRLDALKTENPAIRLNGKYSRRSDMLWAEELTRNGYRVMRVRLRLYHDRSMDSKKVDYDKLFRDMLGAAAYKAYGNRGCVNKAEFIRRFRHIAVERYWELVASMQRSLGLCNAIKKLVRENTDRLNEKQRKGLETFVNEMAEQIDGGRGVVDRIITDMDRMAEIHWNGLCKHARDKSENETVDITRLIAADAKAVIRQTLSTGELRVLGSGSEGVVLTDEHSVFKCVRKDAIEDASVQFLEGLAGKKLESPLYSIDSVMRAGGWVVIRYPFEKLRPYTGGSGPGLIRLLRAFRKSRLVATNFTPWNIMTIDGRVRFIDLGRDLIPYDDFEFEKMLRRAWLTFRFAGYTPETLRPLMTRTIHDDDFPEMKGFPLFRTAVFGPSKEDVLDEWILRRVSGRAKSIFDYGCGKGKLTQRLIRNHYTKRCVLYDPNVDRDVWEKRLRPVDGLDLVFINSREEKDLYVSRHRGEFDLVTSILVLCVITDETEFHRVLSDLHELVSDQGLVVVAVCNPNRIHGTTHIQERIVPQEFTPRDTFVWKKIVFSTNAKRNDFHRPEKAYTQAFSEHGFLIEEVFQTPGVNIETFTPDSDFMVFLLRPLK